MAALIRAHDWAATSLGPLGGWPQSLKSIVDLMLGSPSMMSLVWGPEAIHLYNDAFTELLREHRVLALGRSAFDNFAQSRDVFEADVAAGMAGRSARMPAQRYPVLRNGELQDAWFDVDYAPVRDEDGHVAGVLWTLKETTGQVVAERAMRESETRHRLLVGSVAQAVWDTDAQGFVVADSASWRAYTGQTLEELLGYGWLDAIYPDDRAYAERQWRDAMAARTFMDAEFRLRAPDGGWRWTNVRAAPVLDAKGAIEKWAGMNIDIDARKKAEAALRESEELRRIAVTGGRMGTWRWDLRDRLIWGDNAFLDLWGFPPSDEPRDLGDFTDRMTLQGQAEMEDLVSRVIAAGEAFDGSLAIVGGPSSGGRVRWRGQAETERPWIINGVTFDVTGQWLAEERLRESEQVLASDLVHSERLRSLSERLVPEDSFQAIYDEVLSATLAIARADAGTVQIYDSATKSLELLASQGFSRTITDYFHRVDAGSQTACGVALKTGERAFVDFPDEVEDLGCQLLIGENIQSAVAVPLVSRTGTPLGMLNAHWRQAGHRLTERELGFLDLLARQAADLIDRRLGERALRESEARLELALRATDLAAYEWDLSSDVLIANKRFKDMIWMGSDDPIVGASIMKWCVHPADRARIDPELAHAMDPASDGRFVFEHRLSQPGPLGELWMLSHGQVYFDGPDDARRPARVVGTLQDITGRKRIDWALRESEERQAFLLGLSDAVRPLVDPADIQGETTRLLREQLNAA